MQPHPRSRLFAYLHQLAVARQRLNTGRAVCLLAGQRHIGSGVDACRFELLHQHRQRIGAVRQHMPPCADPRVNLRVRRRPGVPRIDRHRCRGSELPEIGGARGTIRNGPRNGRSRRRGFPLRARVRRNRTIPGRAVRRRRNRLYRGPHQWPCKSPQHHGDAEHDDCQKAPSPASTQARQSISKREQLSTFHVPFMF